MAIVARQRKSGVVYYVNYFADGKSSGKNAGPTSARPSA